MLVFLVLLQTTTAKWWMANASSSHWLFTAVLHTVTLTPHHVTSEHFIFIHVSPFQLFVGNVCVCVCVCVCVSLSFCVQLLFPAFHLHLCACVSSSKLDTAPLVSCLTPEHTWKSERACQHKTAHSYYWLLCVEFTTVSSAPYCCCTAREDAYNSTAGYSALWTREKLRDRPVWL